MPRLSCFLLGLLLGLVTVVPMREYRNTLQREQQIQNYGAALARMAAQQAVDAALNHDLVSLQVILQDVVANPGVVLATIHDVENNLLVQSGDARRVQQLDNEVLAHTAPITLHDSVAGYVSVTVAAERGADAAVAIPVVVLALVLLVAAGAPIYDRRHRIFIRRPRASADCNENSLNDDPLASIDDDAVLTPDVHDEEDVTVEENYAYARLNLLNARHLDQQLSADMSSRVRAAYLDFLEEVLPLYNGQLIETAADQQLIRFAETDVAGEADFRAACSVYLISRLAMDRKPFPLQVAAIVGDSAVLSEELPAPAKAGLWLTESAADKPLLHSRLQVSATADQHLFQVKEFQQPYRALLEKQVAQLAARVGH